MPETAEKPAMPDTLSVEAYVAEVLATLTPLPAVDTPLFAAHGLVLAQDVTAALPVPPWTNSAMDGYAVRARDTESAAPQAPVILPVAGDVPAGTAPAPLVPGTAQRIMTGAMLPENADAVVKVEDTDQAPGPHPPPAEVGIRVAARPGLNVRQAGEDVGIGDSVLTAGTFMTATAVASLASVGLSAVRAFPRPRVAVVSTGAELVEPGQELPAGAIPDSNSLLLAGLVAEHGSPRSPAAVTPPSHWRWPSSRRRAGPISSSPPAGCRPAPSTPWSCWLRMMRTARTSRTLQTARCGCVCPRSPCSRASRRATAWCVSRTAGRIGRCPSSPCRVTR